MARTRTAEHSLTKLLDRSRRPVYAIDAERRIAYCNSALTAWLGLESQQVIGRRVEYHSEPAEDGEASRETAGPLAGLCPPPRVLAGESASGTVSCVDRGGHLVHRRAEFVPLQPRERRRPVTAGGSAVLVLLTDRDLTPQELAADISAEPSADELHRAIRRFRRGQAQRYALESLLGESAVMRQVRAQVAAAAASGANAVICGRRGTGRSHVARAIHYSAAAGDPTVKLVQVDGELLSDDHWRRRLSSLSGPPADAKHRPTLLLENLERMPPQHQEQLHEAIRQKLFTARIVATLENSRYAPCAVVGAADDTTTRESVDGAKSAPATLDPNLLSELSTITIRLPRLVERLEDLPLLAQYFLEASNRGSEKQVGSIRPEALDLLALYSWPRELAELREVVATAHAAASTHEITPADLPVVVHHAVRAAEVPRRQPPEPVVLDQLLASIEKELIERALKQANGNKTEAAALLGMTRPRLYRRLVQLGLVSETPSEITAEPAEPIIFEPESPEDEP